MLDDVHPDDVAAVRAAFAQARECRGVKVVVSWRTNTAPAAATDAGPIAGTASSSAAFGRAAAGVSRRVTASIVDRTGVSWVDGVVLEVREVVEVPNVSAGPPQEDAQAPATTSAATGLPDGVGAHRSAAVTERAAARQVGMSGCCTSAVAALDQGVLVTSPDGLIIEANDAAAGLLWAGPEALIGTRIVDWWSPVNGDVSSLVPVFPPDGSGGLVAAVPQATGVVMATGGPQSRAVTATFSSFRDAVSEEWLVAVGLADVTELSENRSQLSVLLSAVSSLNVELQTAISVSAADRDRERHRIALALHDDAVQLLVAARWKIDDVLFASTCGDSVMLAAAVEESGVMLEESVEALRSIIFDLRPSTLDDRGLFAAITDFVGGDGHGCTRWVARNVSGGFGRDSLVDPAMLSLVWRTVCEAVRNTDMHAHADAAVVSLELVRGVVVCSVSDDGVGVSERQLLRAASLGHIGVVSMRESVLAAGGTFHVGYADVLQPRPGWRVAFSVPARVPEAARLGTGGSDRLLR